MMLFLAVAGLAYTASAATESPTVPTPYPTITPAPKSQCLYGDDDLGPFALDCLQAEFLRQGCSMRGLAYPTEDKLNADYDPTSLKSLYNGFSVNDEGKLNENTWKDFKDLVADIKANKADDCRGPTTPTPTQEPTAQPTTMFPTPSPTLIPTAQTPAPTYVENYRFVEIWDSTGGDPYGAAVVPQGITDATYAADGSDASRGQVAALIRAECMRMGFNRQYDYTQYVVQLTMGDFVDYYTMPVADQEAPEDNSQLPLSVCDMLEDPSTYKPMWSESPEGPFRTRDVMEEGNSDKTPDGREYPSWLDREDDQGHGGYGAIRKTDTTPASNRGFKLAISAMRSNSVCTERGSPNELADVHGDSPAYDRYNRLDDAPNDRKPGPYCRRDGANGQKWNRDEITVCNGALPVENLAYSISNRMFGSCDALCVYHPDFSLKTPETPGASTDEEKGKGLKREEYWYWTGSCWKDRTAYGEGEFNNCDPLHDSFEYDDDFEHVQKIQATLCSERCDMENGYVFIAGTCYKNVPAADYSGETGDNNYAKAQAFCEGEDGNLASVLSPAMNDAALEVCDAICYLGLDPDAVGTAAGGFLNGEELVWENWNGGHEGSTLDKDAGIKYLTLDPDGTWSYDTNAREFVALCETEPDMDKDASNEEWAYECLENSDSDVHSTAQMPQLNIADSGFRDADNPGNLEFTVTIPKYMFDAEITFENSTNDAAEYYWEYGNDYWTAGDSPTDPADNIANCNDPLTLTASIPWTVFNLGGAGGVQRLQTWEAEDRSVTDVNTERETDANFANVNYLFGSVMRINVKQPIRTNINDDAVTLGDDSVATRYKREANFVRDVTARIPFILEFQKTISVSTDVDIISTKFNYKTVAAIIQSVQYETQYFVPPYAKIKMQIRTKSQYPYMMDDSKVDEIVLSPNLAAAGGEDNVNLSIEHLMNDVNCTFTNPDHVREGDICTQEWMLTIEPDANVCYATGEYSVEYKTTCFTGREVCYMPFDAQGRTIDSVKFTFKIQTSKFCPNVAEEVDLTGTLEVRGRESFKPDESANANGGDTEGNTDGSFYLQGETIHLFAQTASEKAIITNTEVTMIELEQDLSTLVQTGYNMVPYDEDTEDLTIWTKPSAGRVTTGEVKIKDINGDETTIRLVKDEEVYATGASFDTDEDGSEDYNFSETEAGFKILLHARAFPVNVDSFGSKTLVATLGVTYEQLPDGVQRRRLLQARSGVETGVRTGTSFKVQSFKPLSIPNELGGTASMSMSLTILGDISRANVQGFVMSFEDAIVAALQNEAGSYRVYEKQVACDGVWSKDQKIWARPATSRFNDESRRRLLQTNQRLRIDFTFSKYDMPNAIPLKRMLDIFRRQLSAPVSPLMQQPIFYGSVVHTVNENKEGSNYKAELPYQNTPKRTDGAEEPVDVVNNNAGTNDMFVGAESAASMPSLLFAAAASLLLALW